FGPIVRIISATLRTTGLLSEEGKGRSPPLSMYRALGGLRQTPGRAPEWPGERNTRDRRARDGCRTVDADRSVTMTDRAAAIAGAGATRPLLLVGRCAPAPL